MKQLLIPNYMSLTFRTSCFWCGRRSNEGKNWPL